MGDEVAEVLLKLAIVSCCLNISARYSKKRVEEELSSKSVSKRDEKQAEQTRWLKRDARKSRLCFVDERAIWNADLEKAGWERRKTSSSAFF